MMLSIPEATASSTPYWMIGLSTSGSISFGCALVAGRNLVPRPAAGKTALRIVTLTPASYLNFEARSSRLLPVRRRVIAGFPHGASGKMRDVTEHPTAGEVISHYRLVE